MRRRLAAVVLALAATACSIPEDEGAVELSGSVPFGLLETTTTTAATTAPEAATQQVTVYLLQTIDGSSRLVGVLRDVAVDAGTQQVLANLFTVRPDGAERPTEAGLSTALPASATLLSATPAADGVLVVDVQGLFGSEGIQGNELRNALAQVVWTATEDESVDAVTFRNDGQPVQALIDDGEIAEGPVDRADYRAG